MRNDEVLQRFKTSLLMPFLACWLSLVSMVAVAADYGLVNKEDGQQTIEITKVHIDHYNEEFELLANRPATASERDALVNKIIDNYLLHHYFRRTGLTEEENERISEVNVTGLSVYFTDDADLIGKASKAAADKLYNRHFVLTIADGQRLIEAEELSKIINDQALEAFYRDNIDRYKEVKKIKISQLYLGRKNIKSDEEYVQQANDILSKIEAEKLTVDKALALSEAIFLDKTYSSMSYDDYVRVFGHGFTGSIKSIAAKQWQGPVKSRHGYHLVYIHEQEVSEPLAFDSVKNRVSADFKSHHAPVLVEKKLKELRSRYKIIVDGNLWTDGKETS